MNKTGKIAIIGGVVLLLIVLLYFFGFSKRGDNDSYVSDNWDMTYNPDDRGPYGTYMLKELLDTAGMFGNFLKLNEKLENKLEDDPELNDIYFFIGSKSYLTDSATTFLLDFIDKGNTAFIATEKFPTDLLEEITYSWKKIFIDNQIDSSQYFQFYNSNFQGKRYKYDFIENNRKRLKTWHYFDTEVFNLNYGDTIIHLGANTKNQINFVKIKYGDGYMFLHSTPYLFTNISMMKRDGFQYAENMLKHIPPGRVQWDKYSLKYHYKNMDGNKGGGGEKRESKLQFIMNNPPLLWAFLILLIGAVLYAIFKGRRMQKIIPATESKDNMSLKYIETLSSLYLQEKKHNKLVKLIEKTFLNFIAEHYYIQTNKPDKKFFDKVAAKSHIPKEKIIAIFKSFDQLENTVEVSDEALITLHKKIEHFYKTCR